MRGRGKGQPLHQSCWRRLSTCARYWVLQYCIRLYQAEMTMDIVQCALGLWPGSSCARCIRGAQGKSEGQAHVKLHLSSVEEPKHTLVSTSAGPATDNTVMSVRCCAHLWALWGWRLTVLSPTRQTPSSLSLLVPGARSCVCGTVGFGRSEPSHLPCPGEGGCRGEFVLPARVGSQCVPAHSVAFTRCRAGSHLGGLRSMN